VHYLVRIQHQAISHWFYPCLPFCPIRASVPLFLSKTLHGVSPLLIHVVKISRVTLCTLPVRSIQEDVTSTHAKAHFRLEVSHLWNVSVGVKHDKGVLHPEDYTKLLEKGNHMVSATWSKSSKCYVAHSRKEKLHERSRSFPLPNYPDVFLSPRPRCPSSFLYFPPPFVNLGMRFLLRGEGCNTLYYGNSNQVP
jgi:hypothetical protein